MSTEFTGRVNVKLDTKYQRSGDMLGTLSPLEFRFNQSFADGTGANQAQIMWADSRTLGAGANEELNLDALTYAGTQVFTSIKAIYIYSDEDNGDVLNVGGAAANAWETMLGTGAKVVLRPGGFILAVAPDATGYVVTAATADLLKIENADGATATYRIAIIGEGSVS